VDGSVQASRAGPALDGALEDLCAGASADGGWGYRAGGPLWLEPACLAVIALAAARRREDYEIPFRRGAEWILARQRPDGGFPPCPEVAHSTWVTALAALALARSGHWGAVDRAVAWISRQSGRETSLAVRWRNWLLGVQPDYEDTVSEGWPWFPGASAWVCPTAFAVLALRAVRARQSDPRLSERIRSGQRFLLARMCSDGGWNHGSARSLGYEAGSYPETTGIALLALSGCDSPLLGKSVDRAHRQARSAESRQARLWLQLGLLAHGAPASADSAGSDGDVVTGALSILVRCAAPGRNIFLDGIAGENA
jgi:hypothetical protein